LNRRRRSTGPRRASGPGVAGAAPPLSPREIFRRFWPYARPYRWFIWLTLPFIVLAPAVETARIWLFKVVVDRVLVPRDFGPFWWIALGYAGLTFVAGAIAGLAGGLYAFHEGFVWPNLLGVILSTQIVLYALFGGVGTLIGSVIGVVVIEIATFVLADNYPTIWPIILGVLLLLVILFRPGGLISLVVPERERIGRFGAPSRRRARVGGEAVGGAA